MPNRAKQFIRDLNSLCKKGNPQTLSIDFHSLCKIYKAERVTEVNSNDFWRVGRNTVYLNQQTGKFCVR